MHEIKFRAWDKDIGMYAVTTLQWHACNQHNAWPFYPDACRPKNRTFGHNAILLQYTGLVDNEGREIYEGDVVRYAGIDSFIFWEQESCSFRIKRSGKQTVQEVPLRKNILSQIRVIGNIYENPELLKGGN
jgi:uncharacterized phage protein (TIGR01671 family)